MQNNPNIYDLSSLKLAKAQLEAQLIQSEINIHNNVEEIKNSLFSLGTSSTSKGVSSLLNVSTKELGRIVSSFVITKWIKPKSNLVRKASVFFSSLLLQKYSSTLIKAITNLLPKDIQDKLDE